MLTTRLEHYGCYSLRTPPCTRLITSYSPIKSRSPLRGVDGGRIIARTEALPKKASRGTWRWRGDSMVVPCCIPSVAGVYVPVERVLMMQPGHGRSFSHKETSARSKPRRINSWQTLLFLLWILRERHITAKDQRLLAAFKLRRDPRNTCLVLATCEFVAKTPHWSLPRVSRSTDRVTTPGDSITFSM